MTVGFNPLSDHAGGRKESRSMLSKASDGGGCKHPCSLLEKNEIVAHNFARTGLRLTQKPATWLKQELKQQS